MQIAVIDDWQHVAEGVVDSTSLQVVDAALLQRLAWQARRCGY